jgi:hypothetical protein
VPSGLPGKQHSAYPSDKREVGIRLDEDRSYHIKTQPMFLDYQSEISDLIRSTMY